MALVSSSEISAWMNTGDHVATATLTAAEERATAWLERMTGRPLVENDSHVLYARGPGGYVLTLPYPRKPSGTISIEARAGIADLWAAVSSSNYSVYDDSIRNTEIVLRTDSVWPRGEYLLKLTMQVGYDDTSCPDDLKRAVLRLIAFDLQGRFLTYDEADSDRRQTDTSKMPWDVQATIARYRRIDWAQQMRRRL